MHCYITLSYVYKSLCIDIVTKTMHLREAILGEHWTYASRGNNVSRMKVNFHNAGTGSKLWSNAFNLNLLVAQTNSNTTGV